MKGNKQIEKIVTWDCLEVVTKIPKDFVSLIITSPPYNLNLNYDTYTDNLSHEDYLSWMKSIWVECQRVLRPWWRLIINIAPTWISSFVPLHIDMVNICREIWLTFRTEILRYKQTIRNRTARGSWKSPRNPHVLPSREYVLVFQKDQPHLDGNKEDSDITAEEFKMRTDAFWYIPPEKNRKWHPAPFPEELIRRLVKLYSYRNDIIMDPFWWTWTVAYIAKTHHRQFIHIDISNDYNKIAKERLNNTENLFSVKVMPKYNLSLTKLNTTIK